MRPSYLPKLRNGIVAVRGLTPAVSRAQQNGTSVPQDSQHEAAQGMGSADLFSEIFEGIPPGELRKSPSSKRPPRNSSGGALGPRSWKLRALFQGAASSTSDRHMSVTAQAEEPEQPEQQDGSDMLVEIDLNGIKHTFSSLLLRDMCRCERCVDPSSKQKLFSTVDIPPTVKANVLGWKRDVVAMRWLNDVTGYGQEHVTELRLEDLRAAVGGQQASVPDFQNGNMLWNDSNFRAQTTDLDYNAYMTSDSTLLRALRQLHTHGLLFLTSVPPSADSVSQIANRIGPLKNTFYGSTWDVRSVPNATNVAYTAQDLGFHMDLLYMIQPPHLQLLHCIRSSAQGGASLFSDSYAAVAALREKDLGAYMTLCREKVGFHYHNDGKHYRYDRPVIELNRGGIGFLDFGWSLRAGMADEISAVSWSPPFQAPFNLEPMSSRTITNESLQHWHLAARHFRDLVERADAVHERLMQPGTCVIFDNRRVLHARRAFHVGDEGTERWLRGAYVDLDPFLSRLRVLEGERVE